MVGDNLCIKWQHDYVTSATVRNVWSLRQLCIIIPAWNPTKLYACIAKRNVCIALCKQIFNIRFNTTTWITMQCVYTIII